MAFYPRSSARQWVRSNLRRYFVACYTPFGPDGEIDEPALRRNVHVTLAKPGVGGISLHSIHQEFWTLTIAERKRITELVLDEVAGKAHVIVGVSDPAARNVVDLARHADAAGAAAVMIWPPFYGPRTPDGVRAFYEHVAERIDIGFFAYSTTLAELGYWLDGSQVEQLLPIEHLCGVQVTVLDPKQVDDVMHRAGDHICVTTSLEESFLRIRREFPALAPDFTLGSSRPLFLQNAAHPYCGRFMDAALSDDFVEAEKYQRIIQELAQRLQTRYFAKGFHHVSLFKRLAGLLGLETHGLRPPLSEPDPGEMEECIGVLKGAGLL